MTKFKYLVTFEVVQKYTVNIEAVDVDDAERQLDRMPFNLLFAIANRVDEDPDEIDVVRAVMVEQGES